VGIIIGVDPSAISTCGDESDSYVWFERSVKYSGGFNLDPKLAVLRNGQIKSNEFRSTPLHKKG
jgi:hypothetical protein